MNLAARTPAPDLAHCVQLWKAAINDGRMDAFGACYTLTACLRVPLSPEAIQGRAAIQKYEAAFAGAFSEAALQIRSCIAEADTVAFEWEYRGINTGALPTPAGLLEPTDRPVHLEGASFLRFTRDGLIAEEHRYYDTHALLVQLGIRG